MTWRVSQSESIGFKENFSACIIGHQFASYRKFSLKNFPGDDGEVFKVKKTSQSKKLRKMLIKEKVKPKVAEDIEEVEVGCSVLSVPCSEGNIAERAWLRNVIFLFPIDSFVLTRWFYPLLRRPECDKRIIPS